METKHSTSGGRIPELDGLRGILAWTVVWTHILICCGWFGPNLRGHSVLNEMAGSAVDVFMPLSGFAITRLLLVERESCSHYLWGRLCRLVPAYWLALAAGMALNGWLGANLRHLRSWSVTPMDGWNPAFSSSSWIGAQRAAAGRTVHLSRRGLESVTGMAVLLSRASCIDFGDAHALGFCDFSHARRHWGTVLRKSYIVVLECILAGKVGLLPCWSP
jgi:Acyltransferase family